MVRSSLERQFHLIVVWLHLTLCKKNEGDCFSRLRETEIWLAQFGSRLQISRLFKNRLINFIENLTIGLKKINDQCIKGCSRSCPHPSKKNESNEIPREVNTVEIWTQPLHLFILNSCFFVLFVCVFFRKLVTNIKNLDYIFSYNKFDKIKLN